jgi:hypothetical protein
MPIPNALLLIPVLSSGALLLAGCGTTGTTSRFTVPLEPATPAIATGSLHVAPASMAPDAPRLYVVHVREWGRFDEADLRNIEQSLASTLDKHRSSSSSAVVAPLDIHVHVRRYLVGLSNTAGAVLACVTWAAVTPEQRIVFSEQFYTPGSTAYVGTIGGVKDSVHQAIVRRIATTSIYLAADPAVARSRPRESAGTYAQLDDAIARLPGEMVSLGNPAAMASPSPVVSTQGMFAVSAAQLMPWKAAKPPTAFDWNAYLNCASPCAMKR